MNRVLVLGSGLLGTEIIKQTNWDWVSRKKDFLDICNPITYFNYLKNYDTILNCTGYTKTYDPDKTQSLEVNYKAVVKLADACDYMNVKIVQISTDYIYANSKHPSSEESVPANAPNWYSYYKMCADAYVQLKKKHLIIRCSFKKNPFPHERAITTQLGNFDYANIISEQIIYLINHDASGVFNIGTGIKDIYSLAVQTRPDVIPCDFVLHETMPTDVTLDLTKFNKFKEEHDVYQYSNPGV
jgi:hypothetical protein